MLRIFKLSTILLVVLSVGCADQTEPKGSLSDDERDNTVTLSAVETKEIEEAIVSSTSIEVGKDYHSES